MKNSKSKIIIGIIAGVIVALNITLVVIYSVAYNKPTPEKIYETASQQVVEVKAQTGENLVAYGSAVLINSEGYFISNAHVISYTQLSILQEFENYYVRFPFETDYRAATLISYDVDKDISILKLTEKPSFSLKPISFADISKIKPGEEVYAIGNGMNHGVGITTGNISLARVNIKYGGITRSVIQCDLIINEGNSGGALVNNKGKLLGLTTFRIKDGKGNSIYGIAFCIPVDVIAAYLNSQSIAHK